tara:strand:- start:499 stop:759 length:261 start_codon:yes stop_codon:yes gene_type:complete
MKLKTILTLLLTIFITFSCAATSESDLQKERKQKLDQLNEECDFATVELAFPEDIYVCYKSPSNIKKTKELTEVDLGDEANQDESE